MNIKELAERYIETTRPSEIKKQRLTDIVDVMARIEYYLISKKLRQEKTQFKKVV